MFFISLKASATICVRFKRLTVHFNIFQTLQKGRLKTPKFLIPCSMTFIWER